MKSIRVKLLLLASALVSALPINVFANEVNLYSARKEALIKPLLEAFTAASGIRVNIVSSKADALLKRIQAEGANSPADVLLTTDAGRLHRAKQAAVLSTVESAELAKNIPENLRDPDGEWFGLSVRARPIMVTDAELAGKISRYEDLTKPEFRKQICIRSSSNIYNQSLIASMIDASGDAEAQAWAQGLVANFARRPQGGDRDQIRAAAAGQCTIAVANTYYLAQMLADPSKQVDYKSAKAMTIIWPNQDDRGVHINVSGAGVIKTAPNRTNAIKLIEFLSSDTAQKIYADVNYEFPVQESIASNAILSSWGEFKRDAINLSTLGANNSAAVKLMDRAGWK